MQVRISSYMSGHVTRSVDNFMLTLWNCVNTLSFASPKASTVISGERVRLYNHGGRFDTGSIVVQRERCNGNLSENSALGLFQSRRLHMLRRDNIVTTTAIILYYCCRGLMAFEPHSQRLPPCCAILAHKSSIRHLNCSSMQNQESRETVLCLKKRSNKEDLNKAKFQMCSRRSSAPEILKIHHTATETHIFTVTQHTVVD